jgi:hypothetical protein
MRLIPQRIFLTRVLLLSKLLLVYATFTGCQENVVCEDATATRLRINFFRLVDGGPAVAATVDSLTIYSMPRTGEIIYDNRKNVGRVELPLNPGEDGSTFVFEFPGSSDTIHFSYERKLHLISVDCGFTMFYELNHIATTNHTISLHEISTNLVSNALDEHVKIFLPPVAAAR